jgi:hypothetical protein
VDNKRCSKILQETLLNYYMKYSVSNDLLPFMVGQSHDSSTAECQGCDVISALSAGHSSAVHGV